MPSAKRNWECKMPCEKKRIQRERWTATISLNIDFFFHLWSTSLSSIREIRRRLRGPRINVSPSLFFRKIERGKLLCLTVTFFELIYKLEGNKKRFSREIKYRFHAPLKSSSSENWMNVKFQIAKILFCKKLHRDFQGRLNTGFMPTEKFVFGKLNECKISDWKKQMPWWKVWEFFLSSRLNHNQAASKCHVEKKKMQI